MDNRIEKLILELPPLPKTAIEIEKVYQNPNSAFSDMAKILQQDPLLTADILKSANSPLYGFSREITNIQTAISMFGMATIRGFAMASIVKKSFKIDLSAYHMNDSDLSKLSQTQSAIITNWYSKIDKKALETLNPAAFLMDIGKVIISQLIITDGKKEEFWEGLNAEGTCQTEEKFVGINYNELSAAIFEKWQFEPTLIQTIKFAYTPLQATDETIMNYAKILQVVKIAFTPQQKITEESIVAAVNKAKQYKLDFETLERVLNEVLERL